jgi:hypothetical protein
MQQFASKTTYLDLTTSPQTLEGGRPVRVVGMIFSGTDVFTVSTGDGSATLLVVDNSIVPCRVLDVSFTADKGIRVSVAAPGAGKSCTVFHTHPGS